MFSKILKRFRLPACMLLALFVASACGLIYKQNIQQGNALEQKDLDELYIGMNKRQVLFVLGSPSIHDPFHQRRWDYVQTFSRRGGKIVQRTVTLRFDDNDLLVEMIGANQTPAEPAAAGSGPQVAASASADTAADEQASPLAAGAKEVSEKQVVEPEIKGLGERNAQDRQLEDDNKTTAPDSGG